MAKKPKKSPPIENVQHLQIILHIKEIETKLDRLAIDGWTVISCFPIDANTLELGDEARVFCLLRRIVTT